LFKNGVLAANIVLLINISVIYYPCLVLMIN
jgi:hypothetical protein